MRNAVRFLLLLFLARLVVGPFLALRQLVVFLVYGTCFTAYVLAYALYEPFVYLWDPLKLILHAVFEWRYAGRVLGRYGKMGWEDTATSRAVWEYSWERPRSL